ncbi:MAG: HIT family protein [Methylophilaceae bacterium]|nr:HIT family protein [Methylophilaceae bacterium]
MAKECVFCNSVGGDLLWQNDLCRVVLVDDQNYVGFCRVILNKHVKEMTDLSEAERLRIMQITFAVEQVLRDVLQPTKINLASLGNKTPHIHWHVIPRFETDIHFPETIWSAQVREATIPSALGLKESLQAKLSAVLSTN